jgi:Condensation domain/Phosphopantetheine attachment site
MSEPAPRRYPASSLQAGYHAYRVATRSLDKAFFTLRFVLRGDVDAPRLDAAAAHTIREVEALSKWPDLHPLPDPGELGGAPASHAVRAADGGADLRLTVHHLAADGGAIPAICHRIGHHYANPGHVPGPASLRALRLHSALARLAADREDSDYEYWAETWSKADAGGQPADTRPAAGRYEHGSADIRPDMLRASQRARRTPLLPLLIGASTDAVRHVLADQLGFVVVPLDLRALAELGERDADAIGFAVNSLIVPAYGLPGGQDRLPAIAAELLDHALTPTPSIAARYAREAGRPAPPAPWLVQIVREPLPVIDLPGVSCLASLDGDPVPGRAGMLTLVTGPRPRVEVDALDLTPEAASELVTVLARLLEGGDPPGPAGRARRPARDPVTSGPRAGTVGARAEVADAVAAGWRQVLGISDVPADGHFLALGGTSIVAVSLSHVLEISFGLALKPDAILANPRFADQVALARPVDGPSREPPGPTAVSRGAVRMPSVMYRYMKHAIGGAFNPEYNLGFAWEVAGPLDVGALAAALRGCCERHEALRLRYLQDGADWKVYEAWPDDPLEIVHQDLGQADDDGLVDLAERERARQFMPGQPLIRGKLWLDGGNRRHLLNLTVPHMIFDGWSKDVLMADLGTLYRDAGADRRPPPAGWSQYREFLLSNVDRSFEAFSYWHGRLRGWQPILQLDDQVRARTQSGLPAATQTTKLDAGAFARRRKELAARGISLEIAAITSVIDGIGRVFGKDDILIGLPVANRDDARWASTIGLLSLYLPIRWPSVSGSPPSLAGVRDLVREALDHRLPFETVKAVLDSGIHTDCAVTISSFHRELQLEGTRLRPLIYPPSSAHRPMDVILDAAGQAPTLTIGYMRQVVEAGQVRALLAHVAGQLT